MAKLLWLKLYTEILDDPKLAGWTGDQFRVFVYLLCLAREAEEPGFIPMTPAEISWRIRRPLEEVESTLELCQQGDRPILEVTDGGVLILKFLDRQYDNPSDTPGETRKRKQRQRDKKKVSRECHDNVTTCHETEERRVEEIRGDIDQDKSIKDIVPYAEIIGYMNLVCGTKYKASTRTTKEHIHARWKEGFKFDDFKQVIDNKARDWLNDSKMSKFLRPATLFGTKFEGYLNQVEAQNIPDAWHEIRKFAEEGVN